MPFTVVFAAGTFLLTPVQAQHADFCKQLDGGGIYDVPTDSCYVALGDGNEVGILEGEAIGNMKYSGACNGHVPVKECTNLPEK